MIDEFTEFAKVCFTEYKDLVNMHYQMVAAARSVRMAHEMDPNLKVGCMIAGVCFYALTSDPEEVMASYKFFQDNFAYCADTMVRGYYPSYAPRIWKEAGVTIDITEQDKKDLMEGKSDLI